MARPRRELAVIVCSDADVAVAHVTARSFAETSGLCSGAAWAFAIAVAEAAGNIAEHSIGGVVVFRRLEGSPVGVELEASDGGPGFLDAAAALASARMDRRASAGASRRRGLGIGLGAIYRLMDTLEIENRRGGAWVRATIRDRRGVKRQEDLTSHEN